MERFAKILLLLITIGILIWTSWVSYRRLGAFGCGDQCFNFTAAFFMSKGKTLYSEIFFNHQPLMVYLSYLIQKILHSDTLYHLVLYHRLFIILFSILMDILFVFRFHWSGIGFVLFYETTKYYLLGNSFLPETVVAYLTAYLFGLWWKKSEKQFFWLDCLTASIFTWLTIFLRAPYLPLAIFLYLLWFFPFQRKKLPSLILLSLLSLITLATLPLKDYLYDLVLINQQFVQNEVQSIGIQGIKFLKIFFYPILIIFSGPNTFFHRILFGLDLIFLVSLSRLAIKLKKPIMAIIIIFLLGLAGIRFIPPGTMYYQAFHLLPFYSLFLMVIFQLLNKTAKIQLLFLTLLLSYIIFPKESFLKEKVNPQEEFTVNYANYFTHGTVIKTLSRPEDTLFLDLWDDLIYWQAGLDSAYQYSLYTPAMINSPKFTQARLAMFENQPPDFYYSYYGASKNCAPLFPKENQEDYLQFYFSGKPTCLYLKKTKLSEINDNQWQEIAKLGFHLLSKE